jgi:hypothetical protein
MAMGIVKKSCRIHWREHLVRLFLGMTLSLQHGNLPTRHPHRLYTGRPPLGGPNGPLQWKTAASGELIPSYDEA